MPFDQLKRREFISLLGGAAAWPLAARAQQQDRIWQVAFLHPYLESDPEVQTRVAAFAQGLAGGNVTGSTQLSVEVGPKRLELARELFPGAATVALLVNPANPLAATVSKDLQAVADALGVRLHVLHASTEADFEAAFAKAAQLRVAALVIGSADPLFGSHAAQLGALALRHSVPAIYFRREFAAAGGLMSYRGSITETYRLAGLYAGRILKGEKPADLPVVQSTKVELILNLKTAKALGITVPLPLSGRADEIIE
jgi:putative tryptophan/tyrosine transport system substrate-binding protein